MKQATSFIGLTFRQFPGGEWNPGGPNLTEHPEEVMLTVSCFQEARVRVTLLSRSTPYRRIVNQPEVPLALPHGLCYTLSPPHCLSYTLSPSLSLPHCLSLPLSLLLSLPVSHLYRLTNLNLMNSELPHIQRKSHPPTPRPSTWARFLQWTYGSVVPSLNHA